MRSQIGNPGEWDGIKLILTNNLSFHNFAAIKNVRRRLFHGGKEEDKLDDDFIKEIKNYLEPMRKALIFGIGNIWGVGNAVLSSIVNKNPRRAGQMPWTILRGNLKNIPKDFDELIRNYPTLEAEITRKQFSISQDGNLEVEFKVAHHFHATSAVKWALTETQAWGNKDSGIQQFTLKEASINKAKKATKI